MLDYGKVRATAAPIPFEIVYIDLDDLSDKTHVSLASCRRQFDNLKRILKQVLDQEGSLIHHVQRGFALSDDLSRYYAAMIFLCSNRIDTHRKRVCMLSFYDLLFCAAVMMQYWTPLAPRHVLVADRDTGEGEGTRTPVHRTFLVPTCTAEIDVRLGDEARAMKAAFLAAMAVGGSGLPASSGPVAVPVSRTLSRHGSDSAPTSPTSHSHERTLQRIGEEITAATAASLMAGPPQDLMDELRRLIVLRLDLLAECAEQCLASRTAAVERQDGLSSPPLTSEPPSVKPSPDVVPDSVQGPQPIASASNQETTSEMANVLQSPEPEEESAEDIIDPEATLSAVNHLKATLTGTSLKFTVRNLLTLGTHLQTAAGVRSVLCELTDRIVEPAAQQMGWGVEELDILLKSMVVAWDGLEVFMGGLFRAAHRRAFRRLITAIRIMILRIYPVIIS